MTSTAFRSGSMSARAVPFAWAAGAFHDSVQELQPLLRHAGLGGDLGQ
jgi:hypothetical protein